MLRIAHISDTHNYPGLVRQVAAVDCDVIVLTGDVLGNRGRTRETGGRISPAAERRYQESWFRKQAKKWAGDFAGRPVVYVPGNHDFISIEAWLRYYGHDNVHTITAEQPSVEVCGKVFAGFREVGWIDGEWMGEVHDAREAVDRAMACNPDILVTHAPPSGILAGPGDYGIAALTSALFYREHRITHHLYGHAHEDGGRIVTVGGVTFSNAAGHLNMVEVP